jgi:hypothetical protein
MNTKSNGPSTEAMFMARGIDGAGRRAEWTERFGKMKASGTATGKVKSLLMKEMGYLGATEERKLYRQWIKGHPERALPGDPLKAEETKEEESARNQRFAEAVARLPDNAAPAEEIAWIRAHPAMCRLDRQASKGDVLIDERDVLDPGHGRAPSKAAVMALQHWANRPKDFFRLLLTEDKKKSDDADTPKAETDMGLEEVERLLKSLKVPE